MMNNNLPQGWVECEFEKCIEKISPKNKIKQKEYLEDGLYPIVDQGQGLIGGYSNNKDSVIKITSPLIIFGDHTRSFKYINFDFIAGADGIKILKPLLLFNAKLFFYFCQILKIPNKGYSRHYQYLAKIPIKLPPLNEQKRIVQKIEEEFEKIDEGIEKLKLAQEQIKQYKQSVLKSAFDGKLYKTSEWVYNTLGNIFKTSSGGTPKRSNPDYYGGTIPWLKSGELNNGLIIEAEEYITQEGLKNSSAKIFPRGSILIALYGATVGKLGILDFDSATNQAICCIYQNENYNREFLFYFLLFKKEFLVNQGKGGAQPNISQEVIKALTITIPTLDEQEKIVKEIEKHFEIAENTEKIITQNLEKAQQLKQSILKKAFEGRLVPQDPNDEPASVLLEKIKNAHHSKK